MRWRVLLGRALLDLLHGLLLDLGSGRLFVGDSLAGFEDDAGLFWELDFVQLGPVAFS